MRRKSTEKFSACRSQFAIQMSKSSNPADNDGKKPSRNSPHSPAGSVFPRLSCKSAKRKEAPPLALQTIPTGGTGQARKPSSRHKSIRFGAVRSHRRACSLSQLRLNTHSDFLATPSLSWRPTDSNPINCHWAFMEMKITGWRNALRQAIRPPASLTPAQKLRKQRGLRRLARVPVLVCVEWILLSQMELHDLQKVFSQKAHVGGLSTVVREIEYQRDFEFHGSALKQNAA